LWRSRTAAELDLAPDSRAHRLADGPPWVVRSIGATRRTRTDLHSVASRTDLQSVASADFWHSRARRSDRRADARSSAAIHDIVLLTNTRARSSLHAWRERSDIVAVTTAGKFAVRGNCHDTNETPNSPRASLF
jgi:hypothetical protein